jgi:hypothetical protein
MRREEAEALLAELLRPGFLPHEEDWGGTTRDIAAEMEESRVVFEDGHWVVVLRFGTGQHRYEHRHRHLVLSNGQPDNVEAVAREILDCVILEPHGDGSYRGRPFDLTKDGRMLRDDYE